jgi:hypothetical protein
MEESRRITIPETSRHFDGRIVELEIFPGERIKLAKNRRARASELQRRLESGRPEFGRHGEVTQHLLKSPIGPAEKIRLTGPAQAHQGYQAPGHIARVHKIQTATCNRQDLALEEERRVAGGRIPVVAGTEQQAGVGNHHRELRMCEIAKSELFRDDFAEIVRPLGRHVILVIRNFIVECRLTAIVPEEDTTATRRVSKASAASQTLRAPSSVTTPFLFVRTGRNLS